MRPGLPGDGGRARTACAPTCRRLRQRFSLSLKGATLADLVRMARSCSCNARALRAELEQLAQLRCPAILHWDLNHFVVLVSVRPRRGVDPRPGARRARG